jgi:hypothetical protein
VRETLAGFAAARGIALPEADDAARIDVPAAFGDAGGMPRFTMAFPASLIGSDLGASLMFHHEVAGRGYEFALHRFLDLHLASDDVFVDVGAHWGIHALTAATRWPAQVSVLAIEAHPENCATLAA